MLASVIGVLRQQGRGSVAALAGVSRRALWMRQEEEMRMLEEERRQQDEQQHEDNALLALPAAESVEEELTKRSISNAHDKRKGELVSTC